MSKKKFEIGTIVRKKAINGNPIGPYMTITNEGDISISAEVIDTKEECLLLKRRCYTPQIASLPVHKELLEKLKNGETICIQHKETPLWKKVYDKKPELIRFYSIWYSGDVVFTVENITRIFVLREKTIRIIVDQMICKS